MGARRWLVAVVGLLSFAPPAFAAQPGPAKPFVAPRVSRDYLDRLARLPDWSGMWNIQGGMGGMNVMRDLPRYVKLAEKGLFDLKSLATMTAPLDRAVDALKVAALRTTIGAVVVF